jgi:alpha-galactosidase
MDAVSAGPAVALSRRDFALLLATAARGAARREIERSEPRLPPGLELSRRWVNGVCSFQVKNRGTAPVVPREIVLFEWRHSLPAGTRIYGEGFQMLSQTGGTLGKSTSLGAYEDAAHYRIPKPDDATTVYNLLLLSVAETHHILLAFTSSRRFVGRFHLRPGSIQVACDLEALTLEPSETCDLEDFVVLEGSQKSALLQQLAHLLRANHPIDLPSVPPRGWCSWVAFADNVTAEGVLRNARAVRERTPWLRYIQIDGGYMDRLGDWLEPSASFDGSVRDTLLRVRDMGLEPALWLAPFIAERRSKILASHPSWFIRDDSSAPLPADRVTYGGWKRPPWFALDGTHPEVQEYLEGLLRTLHRKWGSTYFKLDANFWGAMHGGRFHDPKATRVEAYRRGMRAIQRGAGGAFLLGCNHPMWPSLGLIQGSRSSNDIEAKWDRIRSTSQESLSRNWQGGRLWWNDPDTVQFAGSLTPDELGFHLAVVHASRGLVMSSDDVPRLAPEHVARLEKLAGAVGAIPEFDSRMQYGRTTQNGRELRYLLNWDDTPSMRSVPRGKAARDYWTGEPVRDRVLKLPPRSARLLLLD